MKVFTVGLEQKPPIKEGAESPPSPPPGYTSSTAIPIPMGPEVPPTLVARKSKGYKGVLVCMLAVFLIALFALTLSEIAYNRQRDENFFRLRWAELKHRMGYDMDNRIAERIYTLRRDNEINEQKPVTTTVAPVVDNSVEVEGPQNTVNDRLAFFKKLLEGIKKHAEEMGFDGTMSVSVVQVDPFEQQQNMNSDASMDGFGEWHMPEQEQSPKMLGPWRFDDDYSNEMDNRFRNNWNQNQFPGQFDRFDNIQQPQPPQPEMNNFLFQHPQQNNFLPPEDRIQIEPPTPEQMNRWRIGQNDNQGPRGWTHQEDSFVQPPPPPPANIPLHFGSFIPPPMPVNGVPEQPKKWENQQPLPALSIDPVQEPLPSWAFGNSLETPFAEIAPEESKESMNSNEPQPPAIQPEPVQPEPMSSQIHILPIQELQGEHQVEGQKDEESKGFLHEDHPVIQDETPIEPESNQETLLHKEPELTDVDFPAVKFPIEDDAQKHREINPIFFQVDEPHPTQLEK